MNTPFRLWSLSNVEFIYIIYLFIYTRRFDTDTAEKIGSHQYFLVLTAQDESV